MGISVLGPIEVDGRANDLSPRDRVVLSALVVNAGTPMSTDALADALWGGALPASWAKVVYGCVWRLRTLLGTTAIERGPAGYRLTLGDQELDHRLFERLVERGREALAGDDPARASFLVGEGLGLWRGTALADVDEWAPGRVEAARLEGLRMDAEELRVEAEVRVGHAPAVLEQARALVARAPFRERRWALLALALYQSGRQGEALGALHRARTMLVDEFGLDPGHALVELEQQLLRQDPSLAPGGVGESSAPCPYRGLLAYDAQDADLFFGREDDIAACLRRLRDVGVLVVIGPSGIGKSSLVCAGLVASLTRGRTPVLLCTPGARPLDSLAGLKPRGRQTLVVDQAEEVVTLCDDPEQRERFLTALATHVGAGGGLVLSLRADHLGDLAPYPDIARILEAGLYLLGPMREPELRQAVEGPARRAGLRLEPGLVDLMLNELDGEAAGLPMLSHVLRETWERREGPTLTIDGYKATGGIQHAVSQSAESLYSAMDEADRARLRSLLLRLVMPTDGEPVRAKVPRDKVTTDEAHRWLVEQLVGARLLCIDGDTLQIAHEALVRVWPRLRGWLDDDVEGQRLFRHLAGAAEAWESMGRPDSELYRGTRLSRTLEWRDRSSTDLDEAETDFLAASVTLAEEEVRAAEAAAARDRRVRRRLRVSLAGVAVLLTVALGVGTAAVRSADQARGERTRAERAATLAEARRVSAQAQDHEDLATSLLLGLVALELDGASAQGWQDLASTLVRAGSLERTLTGAGGVALDVSSDGAVLASSHPTEGVRLYDTRTMSPIAFGDDVPTSAVRFSPDGRVLATAVNHWTQDGSERIDERPVRLYDLPGGDLAARQPGGWPEGSSVEYSMDFSRDGRRLAAAVNRWDADARHWRETGAVMVWDVRTPSVPLLRIAAPDESLVALSPDGRRVYVAQTDEPTPLRVHAVDSGRLLRTSGALLGDSAGVSALDVSPDGSTLAVGAGDRVLLLDATTLEPRGPALGGHAGDVGVTFSHDGTMLLSTSADGRVVVWDARTGAEVRRVVGWDGVNGNAVFSPDDRTVYTAGVDVMAWDVSGADALLSPAGATAPVAGRLQISLPAPDGRTIARAVGSRLWFVDSGTGRETSRARTGRTVWFHAWSPDSRWFLTVGPGVLTVWDAGTGRMVAERDYAGNVGVLATFSPRGDRLLVHDRAGRIETLDRATLRPVGDPVTVGQVRVLVPDPRGGTVLAFRDDGSVLRVDSTGGGVLATSPAGLVGPGDHDDGYYQGAISPDGAVVVAQHPGGGVRLLDTTTWTWVGQASPVGWGRNVAYAPDGRQFASVDADWVRLWDGRTGAYQSGVPLPGPVPGATVAYLPDGAGLVVSAVDGRTWTVDTRAAHWVERACRLAGRNLTLAEWRQFVPGRPYEVTCPQWPAGS
ncbi:BTAD domain-containing putative transcriptional regulator [Oryzobacter terrae]|uniref:nSTAND1 domain-containing NTPase n=1 Tax=Oryzobacter terrae TaxID=1620385 RepID=UPI00366FDFCE